MAKYRKKPVVIEAEQFTSDIPKLESMGTERTGQMFMEYPVFLDEKGPFLHIKTLEGILRADPGDWIITGVKGERYPCKPDIFEKTYQQVDPGGFEITDTDGKAAATPETTDIPANPA